MKVQLSISLAIAVYLSVDVARAQEDAPRVPPTRPDRSAPRSRRQYTQPAQIHDGDAEPIRLPEPLRDLPSGPREILSQVSRQETLSSTRPSAPGPQRPAVERDETQQRDWLVSSVLDALGRQPENSGLALQRGRESSGWGWLADGTLSRITQQAAAMNAEEEGQEEPLGAQSRDVLFSREDGPRHDFDLRGREEHASTQRIAARNGEVTGSIFGASEASLTTGFGLPISPTASPLAGGIDSWTAAERQELERDRRFTGREPGLEPSVQNGMQNGGWNEYTVSRQSTRDTAPSDFTTITSAASREPVRSTLFDPARESSSIFRNDPTYFPQDGGFERSTRRTESGFASSTARSSAFDSNPWDRSTPAASERWSAPSSAPQPLAPPPRREATPARGSAPISIHQMWD